MSGVYKVLPLTFKDRVLTIAISDPANASAADDLRNLLGIGEVIVHAGFAGSRRWPRSCPSATWARKRASSI